MVNKYVSGPGDSWATNGSLAEVLVASASSYVFFFGLVYLWVYENTKRSI